MNVHRFCRTFILVLAVAALQVSAFTVAAEPAANPAIGMQARPARDLPFVSRSSDDQQKEQSDSRRLHSPDVADVSCWVPFSPSRSRGHRP